MWTQPAVYLKYGEKIDRLLEKYPIDFFHPKWDKRAMDPRNKVGIYKDEWGCVWENKAEGYFGMVVKHPLEDYQMLKKFKPPFGDMRDLAIFGSENCRKHLDKFYLGFGADFFHRMCWLRGMDKVMIDMIDGSTELYKLRETLLEFFSRQVSQQVKNPFDGITFFDDFGSQKQLLISTELWRSFIKPVYEEFFRICKQASKFIFFHSDGYILEIIDDLIEMGVDALNCQVWCMRPEDLGKKFRGRITFWGELDRQTVIPFGTPEDIFESARKMKEHLALPTGGLIGEGEVDGLTPLRNIEVLLKAWK